MADLAGAALRLDKAALGAGGGGRVPGAVSCDLTEGPTTCAVRQTLRTRAPSSMVLSAY